MELQRVKAAGSILFIVAALAVPIAIIIYGLVSGFGVPDHYLIVKSSEVQQIPAGFFQGLWDGFIVPMTLPWSAFDPSVEPVSTYNTGTPYWIGFFLTLFTECFVVFWRPRDKK
jgi:hypothetical protein